MAPHVVIAYALVAVCFWMLINRFQRHERRFLELEASLIEAYLKLSYAEKLNYYELFYDKKGRLMNARMQCRAAVREATRGVWMLTAACFLSAAVGFWKVIHP